MSIQECSTEKSLEVIFSYHLWQSFPNLVVEISTYWVIRVFSFLRKARWLFPRPSCLLLPVGKEGAKERDNLSEPDEVNTQKILGADRKLFQNSLEWKESRP